MDLSVWPAGSVGRNLKNDMKSAQLVFLTINIQVSEWEYWPECSYI